MLCVGALVVGALPHLIGIERVAHQADEFSTR